MNRLLIMVIGLAGALALLVMLVFTPTLAGADLRRAAAVAAIQSGLASLGVSLLTPLAAAGDASSQNNLAVLINRGIGAPRDPVAAARLLNAAANAGLPRAKMNLVLMRMPCDTNFREQALVRLEEFAAAGDRRAASFVADCLIWSFSSMDGAGMTRKMLAAAAIATQTGDADEELKFGWMLTNGLGQLAGSGLDALMRTTAHAAAEYLFRAAEHGRPAAYEGLSKLAENYLALLGSDPLGLRLGVHSPAGWVETAANAGHPKSRCIQGVKLAARLSRDRAPAEDPDHARFQKFFETCLKERNPRQVIFENGKERTLGHDPLFDIWMKDDVFLAQPPRYENYDYDSAGREDALSQMVRLMRSEAAARPQS